VFFFINNAHLDFGFTGIPASLHVSGLHMGRENRAGVQDPGPEKLLPFIFQLEPFGHVEIALTPPALE
jgi:hypothetical protein